MGHMIRQTGILCILAVLFAAGCTILKKPEAPAETKEPEKTPEPEPETVLTGKELEELQGQWYDINGDTVLTFEGDRMTLLYGDYEEVYTVIVTVNYSHKEITAADGRGFGIMSDITIGDDALTAGEMVLDAGGHTFRFVRKENVDQELQIQDLSRDLPKTITSDEIIEFSLVFKKGTVRNYGLGDEYPSGQYSWEISEEGGEYTMSFRITGDSYVVYSYEETVDEAYVRGLPDLFREMDLASYNGYHMANHADLPGYMLYAEYADDEQLIIQADGNAADTCVFDLQKLLAYAEIKTGKMGD